MATLTYPTTEPFRPESMLWRLEDSVAISTSSLNGVTRTKELPGARWVVELSYDQQDDIDAFKKRLAQSREELLRKLAGPQTPKEWASKAKGAADKARKAQAALDNEGRWMKVDRIDGREFSKQLNAMADYVEAARKAAE